MLRDKSVAIMKKNESCTTTAGQQQKSQPLTPDEIQSITNKCYSYINSRKLSPSQKVVVSELANYFIQMRIQLYKGSIRDVVPLLPNQGIDPPHLLITGDPGSGKSFAVDTICEIISILEVGTPAATSYNGIAAVNVDGSTICSMWSIFDSSDNKDLLSDCLFFP